MSTSSDRPEREVSDDDADWRSRFERTDDDFAFDEPADDDEPDDSSSATLFDVPLPRPPHAGSTTVTRS